MESTFSSDHPFPNFLIYSRRFHPLFRAFIINFIFSSRSMFRPRFSLHLFVLSFLFAYLAATRTRNTALVDIDAPSPNTINLDGRCRAGPSFDRTKLNDRKFNSEISSGNSILATIARDLSRYSRCYLTRSLSCFIRFLFVSLRVARKGLL